MILIIIIIIAKPPLYFGALACASQKCLRHNVAEVCAQAEIQYKPVAHEAQGGWARGAAEASWAIASAVAVKEGRLPTTVHAERLDSIAVVPTRTTALAIRRRGRVHPAPPPVRLRATRRAMADAAAGADAE